MSAETQKKAAALAALELITPGMQVGLGTGSTADYFTQGLAAKVSAGLDVTCVATSHRTSELAKSLGLPLLRLDDAPFIDITVDGADEFDDELRLIKGGGGALLIEKIVATSSRRMVVIADQSKHVRQLGAFSLPVELVPVGVKATAWKIERAFLAVGLKVKMTVRSKDGKLFRTDVGNVIVDCAPEGGVLNEPNRLELMLNNIPGVVNCGLFIGICTDVYIGTDHGVTVLQKS
jgi:ribose 5-phosphate isomerase A